MLVLPTIYWSTSIHSIPHYEYNSSDLNVTGDVQFKWWGVAAMAAVFYRHGDHGAVYITEDGEDDPIDSMGFTGQISYFNQQTGLEPGFRYSIYDAQLDRRWTTCTS